MENLDLEYEDDWIIFRERKRQQLQISDYSCTTIRTYNTELLAKVPPPPGSTIKTTLASIQTGDNLPIMLNTHTTKPPDPPAQQLRENISLPLKKR